MGIRGLVILAMSGVMCAGTLTTAPDAGAKPPAVPTKWRVVAHAPNLLAAAVAPTASSVWAFGWRTKRLEGPIFPVTRHWDGHRWSGVQLPSAVRNSGVSCAGESSPANVWAFSGTADPGGNQPRPALALRLRQGRWTVVKKFPGSYISGCNVIGPRDVWVFGGQVAGLGPSTGTWHFNGSAWKEFNTGNFMLVNASVAAPNDIWATAANTRSLRPVMEHWNGRSWRASTSIDSALPVNRPVSLASVKALSASDVWVVAAGSSRKEATFRFVVVHWNGHMWSPVKRGSPGYYLPAAVSDGRGGWWSPPYSPEQEANYLLHRTNGRWIKVPLPVRLLVSPGSTGFAITRVPRTNAMVVAAAELGSHGTKGVVLAFGRL